MVQADAFQALASVTALPLTIELHDWPLFRITMRPNRSNGLRTSSEVAVDEAMTVPRSKIGQHIGSADTVTMRAVDRALSRFSGLA